MATKIQKRLSDASDLAAVLQIKPSELVTVTLFGGDMGTHFHLSMTALGRVIKQLRIPASKVKLHWGDRGHLHVDFQARGVTFTGLVQPDHAAEWVASIEQRREQVTGQSHLQAAKTRPLGLPAPVAG